MPIEFILFGLTLAGVAVFHHHTLYVALTGLAAIIGYQLVFTTFPEGPGLPGLTSHLQHEWVIVTNLACLLLGFAILARHFEKSHIPLALPKLLPDDWKGCFALLVIVFVLSSFLDNIAAAMIGGVDPRDVLHAFVASGVALVVSGLVAAFQQQKHSPIMKSVHHEPRIDWPRVGIVLAMLAAAIAANVVVNVEYPQIADSFPFIGVAVCILPTATIRRPDWELLNEAGHGAAFLLALVLCASLMPVDQLPAASWPTTFGLGFVSAVFDNIPLTKLALEQGGYDWGLLAFAVGYGGSMIWFGSSAGVAITNLYPEARSVGAWLRQGWHVAVAYVIGFFVMLAIMGWDPQAPDRVL